MQPPANRTSLLSFCHLTEELVSKLLLDSRPTTYHLDPAPSNLLQVSPTLIPAVTHTVNSSLATGVFPTAFKQARVTLLLKKPTLNPSLVENYKPISLLTFLSKTLECAVFSQVSFLLFNSFLRTT